MTTLHESGGVVQPTDARTLPDLPPAWEFVYEFASPGGVHRKMNPARWNGSKPSQSYTVYTADQMRAYALQALAVPQAPLQAEPRNEWKEAVLDCLAAWPGMDFPTNTPPKVILDAILSIERVAAVDLQAEPVPVVASEPVGYLAFQADDGKGVFFPTMVLMTSGTMRWHPPVSRVVPLYATPQAEPAVAEQAREAKAMRMLWDDQQPEEKAHYRAVADRAALPPAETSAGAA